MRMYTMEIMGGKRIDNDSKLIYIYIYIFQCLFFIGISKVYDSYIELVNGFVHQPKTGGSSLLLWLQHATTVVK